MTNEMIAAKHVVERLHLHGHQAVIAGGATRDILLGLTPHDIDIATSATPDEVESIFKKTIPVGKQFGVIIVLEGGFEFEVATFREDSKESDGRRPDSVEFSTMEADAQRRDLSINGMFFDPMTEEIHDFVGGGADLEAGVIRFIGDPQERIDEDKLRILRAIRFATRFEFDMDGLTKEVIKKNAHLIEQVSAERVKAEMDKMLRCDKPSEAITLLHELGILSHILPEVDVLWDVEQSPKWHQEGSAGIHTMMVLDEVRVSAPCPLPIELMWAALLHDIGKAPCFKVEDGVIKSHGHDTVGAEMADAIMRRLKASNEEREAVVDLVADHMRVKEAGKMRKSRLRRLVAQPNLHNLMVLGACDSICAHCTVPELEETKFDWVDVINDFTDTLEDCVELPPPLVSGNDLISLGVKPGPIFKTILDKISDMQLEGEVETVEEALEALRKEVASL